VSKAEKIADLIARVLEIIPEGTEDEILVAAFVHMAGRIIGACNEDPQKAVRYWGHTILSRVVADTVHLLHHKHKLDS
jgi:hypothetical protein